MRRMRRRMRRRRNILAPPHVGPPFTARLGGRRLLCRGRAGQRRVRTRGPTFLLQPSRGSRSLSLGASRGGQGASIAPSSIRTA
eukprot:7633566-Pyramimonas_sp.AAC.1